MIRKIDISGKALSLVFSRKEEKVFFLLGISHDPMINICKGEKVPQAAQKVWNFKSC